MVNILEANEAEESVRYQTSTIMKFRWELARKAIGAFSVKFDSIRVFSVRVKRENIIRKAMIGP